MFNRLAIRDEVEMRIWNVFMAYENNDGTYASTEWYCRTKKEALKKKTWYKKTLRNSSILQLSIQSYEIPRNKDGVIKILNNDI